MSSPHFKRGISIVVPPKNVRALLLLCRKCKVTITWAHWSTIAVLATCHLRAICVMGVT
jgi:hypothetical protein